jgi:membrane associated rhomboid family serine protease
VIFKSSLHRQVIREQWPLLTLILLILVIFAFQAALGQGWYRSFMTVPGEVAGSWREVLGGNLAPGNLRAFGTLLSSAFLHASVEHVFFNMIFLWIFAALTVELLGQRWMLLIFAASAVSGSIFHTVLNANDFIPMLGASGAVMGFKGAYLGMAVRWQLPDPHIWPMARPIPPANLAALAVLGIALDFMGLMDHAQSSVAYGAHIGGFLAGLFLTSVVASRPKIER